MQESRLFKILYYLLDRGHATAPELAERFEVSVRTVYRDIDALSGAGIPVYTETGRNGGIYLMNNYMLDRTVLSDGEKMEILSALQGMGTIGNGNGKAAFEKLSGLFRVQPENWYEMDFSRWGSQTADTEKFETLKTAVISHNRVEILYAGAGQEKMKRTVEPFKLLYKSNAWYLKAWCTEKEALRLFKLNRILEWKLLEESFYPKNILPTEVSVLQDVGKRQIILVFRPDMTYRVYDEFDKSQIEELADGRLLVKASMPADEWLISFLLSFGAHVEVLEPVYLKNILAERAMEIYRINTEDGEKPV